MSEFELYEPVISSSDDDELIVYIPGVDYTYFGFHGNINEKMDGLQTGTVHGEITEINEDDEAWTIFIKNIVLSYGDTVNYWIHVIRNGKEYHKTGSWVKEPVEMTLTPLTAPLKAIVDIYEKNYKEIEDASVPSPPPEEGDENE